MTNSEKTTCFTVEMKKQEVIQRLRMQNYRITNQRVMLIDIILAGDCSSCKEIYYKAVKKIPSIGTATVYRMIHTLDEIGAINQNHLYQIQCDTWKENEGACKITLDDQSEINLSEQKWLQVVECGLKCCGIAENQSLKSIEIA